MHIYHLCRRDKCGYDEVYEFIIVAENEKEARRVASNQAGDEGALTWLTYASSTCKPIGRPYPNIGVVILRNFNAG